MLLDISQISLIRQEETESGKMYFMDKFLRHGRGLLLAYDQGFEHGPSDFNAKNVDPDYIIDIAIRSQVFTGIILQKGIAER